MKHAVVFAHPKLHSFTATMAAAYADAVRALGHEVVLRDLYRVGFDPCLRAEEIPEGAGHAVGEDVAAEREVLAGVDVFAFVYPLWFNAPPAILKGYVDRVFSAGFGYELTAGGSEPLLSGRKLISFTSSGAPDHWVHETGALSALIALFDRHLAGVCGLSVLDHVHFGGIVPNVTKEWIEDSKAQVAETVRVQFARSEFLV